MQSLNKKLSVDYENLIETYALSVTVLTFSTLVAAAANIYGGLNEFYAVLITLSVFIASLFAFKIFNRLPAVIIVFSVVMAYGITGFYASLVAVLFIIVFNAGKSYLNQNEVLFALAITSHMGDAITSYIGFLRGFDEANPFADFFVQEIGYYAIFGVKLAVVPLTLYIYLNTKSIQRRLYLKIICCIGLYLTLRNILIVF